MAHEACRATTLTSSDAFSALRMEEDPVQHLDSPMPALHGRYSMRRPYCNMTSTGILPFPPSNEARALPTIAPAALSGSNTFCA